MIQYDNTKQLNIEIPSDPKRILDTLNDAGYEAFIVGGCVRDVILGKTPKDWDITTSAKPEEVKQLFRATIDTGIKHGTVTVLLNKKGYEVTTYRIDGEYLDKRHPESVEFTKNLIEDLKRRDFTINAMAYNPAYGLVDVFDGIGDLEKGIIKCVGDPIERFSEDALRILRAIRFSAQLSFIIEDSTRAAIQIIAPNLVNISNERIRVELDRLLLSNEPGRIRMCFETGISSYIMPWLEKMFKTVQNTPYHAYNVGEHTVRVVENIPNQPYLRWAALLHDVGKPDAKATDENGIDHFHKHDVIGSEKAKEILKDLKFDNRTIDIVYRLITYHDYHVSLTAKGIRKSVNKIGEDIYPLFIQLREADLMAKSSIGIQKGTEELEYIKEMYPQIIAAKDCLTLKDLAVTGNDLIAAGIKPGKDMGIILNEMLEIVLAEPEKNNHDFLMRTIL